METTDLLKVLARPQTKDLPANGRNAYKPFAAYAPSYGAPASLIAAPIYGGSRLVGGLAFQVPADEINNVMTGNQSWQQDGLGSTGQTFLVGSDSLMRSASRPHLNDPKAFLAQLRLRGFKEGTIARLRQYGTTILQQPVTTPAVARALAGGTGTMQVVDYRGTAVLSSFAPLRIKGLDWVILAQMDLDEPYAPIYAFQRRILITATLLMLLVLLVTLLAMALAHLFNKPIQHLRWCSIASRTLTTSNRCPRARTPIRGYGAGGC